MDAQQTARQIGHRTAEQVRGDRASATSPPGARQGRRVPRAGGPPPAASERQRRPRQRPAATPAADRPRHTAGQRSGERPTSQPGTGARGALGRYGEELAGRRLTEAGMTILERNWRAGRTGEIDIVAQDGDTLVICEVKTRRAGSFEHPMAAITPGKAERLRGLAERWLHAHGSAPPGGVRIDLVGIVIPDRGAPEAEHARGVA